MYQARVSSSVSENAMEAARSAAGKLKDMQNIRLLYVYASCDYDLDSMLAGIEEELPGVQVIGNTSFTGVITPDGFLSGEKGFVGMLGIADDGLTIGVAAEEKDSSAFDAGVSAAKKAMAKAGRNDAPAYFYMVCPPGEEEFYLKGITSVIGRVPFFGGSAADNTITGNWSLHRQRRICRRCRSRILLYR